VRGGARWDGRNAVGAKGERSIKRKGSPYVGGLKNAGREKKAELQKKGLWTAFRTRQAVRGQQKGKRQQLTFLGRWCQPTVVEKGRAKKITEMSGNVGPGRGKKRCVEEAGGIAQVGRGRGSWSL